MTTGKNVEPLRKPVSCPSCEMASKREFYPFCSKRCSELDLHRWFSQSYALPIENQERAFEEEPQE